MEMLEFIVCWDTSFWNRKSEWLCMEVPDLHTGGDGGDDYFHTHFHKTVYYC